MKNIRHIFAGAALAALAACGGNDAATVEREGIASQPSANVVAASTDRDKALGGVWQFVADQGRRFKLGAAALVRYGAQDAWVQKDLPAGTAQCTTAFFGANPIAGVKKRCEMWIEEDPPPPPAALTFYLSPSGDDNADGLTRATPLRTLLGAWRKLPATIDRSSRLALLPGTYPLEPGGNALFDRAASAASPLVIGAADGGGTVTLKGGLSLGRVAHVFVEDIDVRVAAGEDTISNNVVQVQASRNVTLRRVRLSGPNPATNPGNFQIQETLKVNQTTDFALLDSEVGGSYQTSLDFVAVHGGRIVGNRFADSGQWCGYVKGGSAGIVVSNNVFTRCAVGGFAAGEGSGFEFHVLPYITYESFGVQVVNNVFHDMIGYGVGVQGGYNTLVAHNTFYNVGSSDIGYGLFSVIHGSRVCYDQVRCDPYVQAGGWGVGPGASAPAPIPNKHTWIYNNVFFNDTVRTRWQSLIVSGPEAQIAQAINIPDPALADDDLRIVGNVMWNPGPELGLGMPTRGCPDTHPTCSTARVLADNRFDLRPELIAPAQGDFRPRSGGNVLQAPTVAIPNFAWLDAPSGVPAGAIVNTPNSDFAGLPRPAGTPIAGALLPP